MGRDMGIMSQFWLSKCSHNFMQEKNFLTYYINFYIIVSVKRLYILEGVTKNGKGKRGTIRQSAVWLFPWVSDEKSKGNEGRRRE